MNLKRGPLRFVRPFLPADFRAFFSKHTQNTRLPYALSAYLRRLRTLHTHQSTRLYTPNSASQSKTAHVQSQYSVTHRPDSDSSSFQRYVQSGNALSTSPGASPSAIPLTVYSATPSHKSSAQNRDDATLSQSLCRCTPNHQTPPDRHTPVRRCVKRTMGKQGLLEVPYNKRRQAKEAGVHLPT